MFWKSKSDYFMTLTKAHLDRIFYNIFESKTLLTIYHTHAYSNKVPTDCVHASSVNNYTGMDN